MFSLPEITGPNIRGAFIFLLTPIYLYLVFLKSTGDASSLDLIFFFTILLLYFIPMQILRSENDLVIDFEEFTEDPDIAGLFTVMMQAFIVIPITIYIEDKSLGWFEIIKIPLYAYFIYLWWVSTEILLRLFSVGSFLNKIKIVGVYFLLVTFITIYALSPGAPTVISTIVASFLVFALSTPHTIIMFGKILVNLNKQVENMGKNRDVDALSDNIIWIFVIVYPLLALLQVPTVTFTIDMPKEYLSYMIVAASSFGVYFQLRLVLSSFVKDKKQLLISIAVLFTVFYGVIWYLI